jgi:hypothetical protein
LRGSSTWDGVEIVIPRANVSLPFAAATTDSGFHTGSACSQQACPGEAPINVGRPMAVSGT